MTQKVELPGIIETPPEKKHISLVLIEEGLKQTDTNLQDHETAIRKLTDQLNQLQAMRIAATAQKNLLQELEKKIQELDK